jgi:putative spermidine/putrescine transport system ATP-binding protein
MSVVVERVTKRFGPTVALDAVSLEVSQGEMVALLGPSGCGKTTLLRAIAGLGKPDEGRVLLDGVDVTWVPVRQRNVGLVFQSYALFPNMTVRGNIAFPLDIRRVRPAEIARRVDELLELLQLTDQAARYPNQLSGGQQQRAALGRAIAPNPAVLLLDEPLSALDALVRVTLREEIRRVQQQLGISALYVTHDQSEAMAIADRVAVMRAGRIEQIDEPPVLYDEPASRFAATFVGSRNALELPVAGGRVALGGAFAVAAPAAAGHRAVAFFRPEDVEILPAGQGHPAVVEVRLFLGSTTRLHLRTEGAAGTARLYADLPSRAAAGLEAGSELGFRVDPGLVRVFPADGAGGA